MPGKVTDAGRGWRSAPGRELWRWPRTEDALLGNGNGNGNVYGLDRSSIGAGALVSMAGMDRPRSLDTLQYPVEQAVALSTPRLLVYRRMVEENISLLRRYLEEVVPGSGFRHLNTHVKTHKSAWVTRLLCSSGIRKFKCTLQELDMLLEERAGDILVAYPLLPHDAERVAERIARFQDQRLTAQVASIEHAEYLAAAARRHRVEVDCLVDIDIGNHRTGLRPDRAADLARTVSGSSALAPLRIRGLHAYDGHNNSPDPAERAAVAQRAMQEVVDCARSLERAGVRVERLVVGGTPAFIPDLRELVSRHRVDAQVDVSPGTWVYWDTHYERKMPGLFRFAALLLAQVMDTPGDDLVTLNLGHKRWSLDHGPLDLFNIPGAEVVLTSEEHTVLRCPPGARPGLLEPVLMAPKHVCPTVNLWESFTLIGPGGEVEAESVAVTARNR